MNPERKRRKPRKRTNKEIPAKGRLRDMADRLWSLAVRADWGGRCAVCGFGKCEAHHLVPRHNQATRYDLGNGIALCPKHHKFDKDVSPHQNAAGWLQWLRQHHPAFAKAYEQDPKPRFDGITTALYYCDVIQDLRQYVDEGDFERVVGIRFAKYLAESAAIKRMEEDS
jgi:hypothetical protein